MEDLLRHHLWLTTYNLRRIEEYIHTFIYGIPYRFGSNQKTALEPLALALFTASFTQSCKVSELTQLLNHPCSITYPGTGIYFVRISMTFGSCATSFLLLNELRLMYSRYHKFFFISRSNLYCCVLGLAHAPDVARLHGVGEDCVAGIVSNNNCSLNQIFLDSVSREIFS
jgi:hypothetical protein